LTSNIILLYASHPITTSNALIGHPPPGRPHPWGTTGLHGYDLDDGEMMM